MVIVSDLSLLMMVYVPGSEAMFADLCYFSVRSVQVIEQETWLLNLLVFISPFIHYNY